MLSIIPSHNLKIFNKKYIFIYIRYLPLNILLRRSIRYRELDFLLQVPKQYAQT